MVSRYPLAPLIVERVLDSDIGPISVRIGMPRQDGQAWVCPHLIEGSGRSCGLHGAGIDAMQALWHALTMIAHDLRYSESFSGLNLRFLGRPDLGFPLR